MSKVTPEEIARVKGLGFLKNTTNEGFSARIVTKNGVINTEQCRALADISEKYGIGKVSFTSRLCVEIPGIKLDDVDATMKACEAVGMVTGGTGSRVRPVVACKGTVCHYGNTDTQQFALEIHEEFYKKWYDVKLPHKFKIGVGGCPNNCIKPELNDFAIVGLNIPNYDSDLCSGCKKCSVQAACPMDAIEFVDGVMHINEEKCNDCGRCVGTCAFDAIPDGKKAFRVYIGGRWGKHVRAGSPLPGSYSKEEVMAIIEKTLLLYREKGITGERLGGMLDRVGVDNFFKEVLSDDILSRKQAILDAQLHLVGGAKC